MNNKKHLSTVILSFGIMLSITGKAQNIQDTVKRNPLDSIVSYDIFDKLSEPAAGSVILGGDDVRPVINEMKAQKNKMKGFRIRIFRESKQGASRRAENRKNEVEKTYPELPVYVTHESPNFYVDVGDYRTPDEAEKMLRLMKASFEEASLLSVKVINFPPL
jgi:hypothetical protein